MDFTPTPEEEAIANDWQEYDEAHRCSEAQEAAAQERNESYAEDVAKPSATPKQIGLASHLLNHLYMDKLGVPEVMQGRADCRGLILEATLATRTLREVSDLIKVLDPRNDDEVARLLQEYGYFDAIDRANAK